MKIIFLIILILLSSCTGKEKLSQKENTIIIKTEENNDSVSIIETETTIGEAATLIMDKGENRVSNILIACRSISGYKLKSGDEFSFNTITGKKTSERGYKYAPVIVDGEKSYGIGGGVCQVSSTIYMAALDAQMEITEHFNHSESVAYAPNNTDATVVFGVKDFKFRNNTDDSVYIYTWVDDGRVYAKIVRKSNTINRF